MGRSRWTRRLSARRQRAITSFFCRLVRRVLSAVLGQRVRCIIREISSLPSAVRFNANLNPRRMLGTNSSNWTYDLSAEINATELDPTPPPSAFKPVVCTFTDEVAANLGNVTNESSTSPPSLVDVEVLPLSTRSTESGTTSLPLTGRIGTTAGPSDVVAAINKFLEDSDIPYWGMVFAAIAIIILIILLCTGFVCACRLCVRNCKARKAEPYQLRQVV